MEMARPGAKVAAACLITAGIAEIMRLCDMGTEPARIYFLAAVLKDLLLVFVPEEVEDAIGEWTDWVVEKIRGIFRRNAVTETTMAGPRDIP